VKPNREHQLLVAAATDLYCVGRIRSIALERAAVWMRRVLRAAPEHSAALRLLGLVELDRRQPTQAAQAYRALAALEQPELRLEGLIGLARCQLARRRPARALAALARAAPRDLVVGAATAEVLHRFYACKAETLRRVGERRRAAALLRRVIRRFEVMGIDAEPLQFELGLCRASSASSEDLLEMKWGPAAVAKPAPQLVYSLRRAAYRKIATACRGRHEERCGLLFGRGRRFERVRWLRNTDQLPELACVSDPRERTRVWHQERSRGSSLLGEFHSHTAGPAVPSRADCAARGRLLVIYSDAFDQLRAWRVRRTYAGTLRTERALTLVS